MEMENDVFDNGLHQRPKIHSSPFKALLIYTPGALLRNGIGYVPADRPEVTDNNHLSFAAYYALYERRLLHCLLYANEIAQAKGVKTIITLPGLGCGQFAGKFKGQLGAMLKQVRKDLLSKYAAQLLSLSAIYYDPFDECDNERW
jgi:hypothetical protein